MDSLREVILFRGNCFGPDRCVFGSDDPVAGLHIGFAEWLRMFSTVTHDFSPDEKTAGVTGYAMDGKTPIYEK